MTPIKLIVFAAIVQLMCSGTLKAQTWGYAPSGNEIFPYPSAYVLSRQGDVLAVFCMPDSTLTISIDTQQSPKTGDNYSVATLFNVDGSAVNRQLTYVPSEAMIYGGASSELINLLSRGQNVNVRTENFGLLSFGLRGSAEAIKRASAMCGGGRKTANSTSNSSESLLALERLLTSTLTQECKEQKGSSVTFSNGAISVLGNGGGEPQVRVDYSRITCNGTPFITSARGVGYCGAGPCLQSIYSMAASGYVLTDSYYE